MPPACICLTQGSSFQEINLTQKNALAIGGILSPATDCHLYPESFNPTFYTQEIQKTYNLSFSREERRDRQEIYNI
jgi:hypothetical protein